MSIEAMKQALEALEGVFEGESRGAEYWTVNGGTYEAVTCMQAIRSLRQAIEQAELAKPEHANPAAKHWHDIYRAKCKDFHDAQARLGAEIVALEEEIAELNVNMSIALVRLRKSRAAIAKAEVTE